MELRQLHYFTKAKELLNFTEAAAQLFISQSTLSQQIKSLEDELGIPLFNRVGKHIYITEAGELFYNNALKCVHLANDGYLLVQDLGNLHTGKLVIGVTFGLKHILTPAIIEFNKQYPLVQIQVIFGTSTEMAEQLYQFKMDFLLTYDNVVNSNSRELKYQPLFSSELSLIVSSKSKIAQKSSITLKDLNSLPLALPAQGFSTRRFIDEVFRKNKITPIVSLEINDIPTLLELIESGPWNSILTRATASDQKNLVAIPIRGINTLQKAAVVSLKEVYEKQAVKAFLEILMEQLKTPKCIE
jgi:LysR family cyn operon transcriptional activator